MSSDGSRTTNSSRISQFGLYRTIDSRTEEFLRLSRKRQIRQGCACAAVSTAITVTVVITVLLVYEYSINTDNKSEQKLNRKTSWLNFFNDSTTFNKAKVTIDPAAAKLFPIILKALSHNKYLEKILEDSSTVVNTDKKYTTEPEYQKHTFHDIKNWVRIPTPGIYAIEYKTSPIQKIPNKNLEYFTNLKKIKDSQRSFHIYDRVLTDRVSSLVAPDTYKYNTETTSTSKYVTIAKIIKSTTKRPPGPVKKNVVVVVPPKKPPLAVQPAVQPCRCPKNLNFLLNKLVKMIQQILPEILLAKPPCKYDNIGTNIARNIEKKEIATSSPASTTKKTSTSTTTSTTSTTTRTSTTSTSTTERTTSTQSTTTTQKVYYRTAKLFPDVDVMTENNEDHKDEKMQDKNSKLVNLLRAYIEKYFKPRAKAIELTIKPYTSSIKSYLESPNSPNYQLASTEPLTREIQTTPGSITTKNEIPRLRKMNLKVIEPLMSLQKLNPTTITPDININDFNLFTLKNMGDLIVPDRNNKSETAPKNSFKREGSPPEPKKKKEKTKENTWDDEVKAVTEYDMGMDDLDTKHTEGVIKSLDDYDKYRPNEYMHPISKLDGDDINSGPKMHSASSNVEPRLHSAEMSTDLKHKRENKLKLLKSMLPIISRSTYLEIDRNHEWRPESRPDYNIVYDNAPYFD